MADEGTLALATLPHGHLSPTSYRMYLRCGRQYWYRYVQGVKAPPTSAMVLGAAASGSLEWTFREHLVRGKHPATTALLERYAALLPQKRLDIQKECAAEMERKDGDSDEYMLDSGVKLLELYDREHGRKLVPTAVEEPFTIPLSTGYALTGRRDLRAGKGKNQKIVDHKTTSKRFPESRAMTDSQLTAYDIAREAEGLLPHALELHVMVRLKRGPEVQILAEPPRTPEVKKEFMENLGIVATAIKAGLFPKTDAVEQTCSYCGYSPQCRPDVYRYYADKRAGDGQ